MTLEELIQTLANTPFHDMSSEHYLSSEHVFIFF